MGNHEYCMNCGESDFHNHRECDPVKVAARIADDEAKEKRAEEAFTKAQARLRAAGIPFRATRDGYGIRRIDVDYWELAK